MKTVFLTTVALSLAFTATAHAAGVSSFLINNGNWSVDANWSNAPAIGGYPDNGNGGLTYDVTVSNRTATLDQNITIQGFTQTGGAVDGSFNLTANDLYTWTGGTLAGTGTNFANGSLSITGTVQQTQRTLVPSVSTTLNGGSLNMQSGALISNQVGVIFNILDDSSVSDDLGGYFVNLGTLLKSGAGNDVSRQGTNISVVSVSLTNRGTVLANAGTLWLACGGRSSGIFTTAPTATIIFGDGNMVFGTLDGATLSGAGTIEFVGGNGTLLTNTVNAPGVNIHVASGELGGPGNLVNSGPFLWTGGQLAGSGTNFVNGPLSITGTVQQTQRTVIPSVSTTLNGGSLNMQSGALISNQVGVTFNILDDSSVIDDTVGFFVNLGTLLKSGAGNDVSRQGTNISVVSVVLTNAGTVNAQSGTLWLEGGYFQTGGATEVDGGTLSSTTPFNILGGSVIGNGTILGTVVNNGTVSAGLSGAGSLTIGGTLTDEAGATLFVQLGGYTPGIGYGFLTVTNRAFLAGNLAVSFSNNYSFISTVTNGASFTVATCGTNFAGAFANVASGGTLATTDGFAQFTVTYAGSTNLVLGDLQILDTVGDGIPNWWRQQYFGSPNTTNHLSCATCDADGDGFSNLQDYLAGIDPTNPATAFRITAVATEGNSVLVTWNTAGGHTNMLQGATGGAGGSFNTNAFVDLPPQVIVTGSGNTTTNQLDAGGATNFPARYYRVRLVP